MGGLQSSSERFGEAENLLLLLHYWLFRNVCTSYFEVEWKRNLVAHGDAREEK